VLTQSLHPLVESGGCPSEYVLCVSQHDDKSANPAGAMGRSPHQGFHETKRCRVAGMGVGSDDPLRGKKSNLGAKAKAQSGLVGIVKGDITSTRQTEWPAMR